MDRRFVVISGLPGSGKTTLGLALAESLRLPLIDKDDILERLFEERGIGDARWRRKLSRESDAIFELQARSSADGAVLVSHWHRAGMTADSGTPTEWITELSPAIVNVNCICEVQVAAGRFARRRRHAGHLDARSLAEVVLSLRSLESVGWLEVGARVDVETSGVVDVVAVSRKIAGIFQLLFRS
jgi:cytidylate kinase